MTKDALNKILEDHKKWLNGDGGRCADLRDADLCRADLCRANLRGANLSDADLCHADLCRADLRDANLSGADLRDADLCDAYLSDTNLCGANLSGVKGIISTINYLEANFERTADGYIAYKTFGGSYCAPTHWKIEEGSVLEEVVNFNRVDLCGCGINVAPLAWVKENYKTGDIWKVLIRWEWLAGVCVPYNTDGKIRCERVELLGVTKR